MARRGSITEQQVFAAADALVAQGREVTATALLDSLGSGSFSTIYKHLTTWEKSRESAKTDRAAVIPDSVLSAFGAAWRVAASEAGKEVTVVREQAAEEIKSAQAQFKEALQTIERLEGESEADAQRMEALSAKVAELEKALHQVESERAALTATTEELRQQVRAQEVEVARLHKESEAERKRHQDERKEREEALKEAAQLRGSIETLQSQNKELLSRLPGQEKPKRS